MKGRESLCAAKGFGGNLSNQRFCSTPLMGGECVHCRADCWWQTIARTCTLLRIFEGVLKASPPSDSIHRGGGSLSSRLLTLGSFFRALNRPIQRKPVPASGRGNRVQEPTAGCTLTPLRLLPGGANPVPGRDFHPQSTSAFSRRTRYGNFSPTEE
jgi:hypothetical protein